MEAREASIHSGRNSDPWGSACSCSGICVHSRRILRAENEAHEARPSKVLHPLGGSVTVYGARSKIRHSRSSAQPNGSTFNDKMPGQQQYSALLVPSRLFDRKEGW